MSESNRRIYLDYNATSPLRPVAREAMLRIMDTPLNPSAVHRFGRDARLHIESARDTIARFVNAKPDGVIFTGSATEANNTVLKGFGDRPIIVSAIEHPAVLRTRPDAKVIRVTSTGIIDLDHLEDALKNAVAPPALVSIMAANNETGVIQPVKQIADIVHQYGGIFHCDAVQIIGRLPFDFLNSGADMISISAHKIGGPVGIGALIVDPKIEFTPLLSGGGQEKNRRAGTENVMGTVGFAAALADTVNDDHEQMQIWRDRIEIALAQIAPDIVFHGQGKDIPRLPNTTMFSLGGLNSDTQMINLDLLGIAVSNGSACSSGRVEPSHVLTAMGVSDRLATSSLRVSLGWQTTEKDIDAFIHGWQDMYDRVKHRLS